MNGKLILYIDQWGNKIQVKSVRELREQVGMGGCRVSKMYCDGEGQTFHVGYVVGRHWFTAYSPVRIPL